jgi:hypothetical protein
VDGAFRTDTEDAVSDGSDAAHRLKQQPSDSFEKGPGSRLSDKSSLILVVVLSLALWAAIWGVFVGIALLWMPY